MHPFQTWGPSLGVSHSRAPCLFHGSAGLSGLVALPHWVLLHHSGCRDLSNCGHPIGWLGWGSNPPSSFATEESLVSHLTSKFSVTNPIKSQKLKAAPHPHPPGVISMEEFLKTARTPFSHVLLIEARRPGSQRKLPGVHPTWRGELVGHKGPSFEPQPPLFTFAFAVPT